MTAVGIDTHKASLAACAIDALGALLAERTFGNDPQGHRELEAWLGAVAPDATIGIEGSSSYGAAVARALVAAGATVREVPPRLSHRERGRTRRAGKSDPIDALAIARVTARETNLPLVRLADRTTELRLLVEAREDAVAEGTRVRNRLHADLVVLVPGTAASIRNLVALRDRRQAASALRGQPGIGPELARMRLARLRAIDREVRGLEARIAALVGRHPLLGLSGVGVITAARLIAEAGDVRRFHSTDAFAMLAGVAPIPASSGQVQRMRLNRGGNRQLNRAFYTIATVQAAHHPPAQAFVARKLAEHRSSREAIRALKRQLVRTVFRLLVEGAPALAEAA